MGRLFADPARSRSTNMAPMALAAASLLAASAIGTPAGTAAEATAATERRRASEITCGIEAALVPARAGAAAVSPLSGASRIMFTRCCGTAASAGAGSLSSAIITVSTRFCGRVS